MNNFKDDLLSMAGEEEIIGVVIGEMGWGSYGSEKIPRYKEIPQGVLLCWNEAEALLDYRYSTEYGAPECNAVYAWTETRVIFVSQYDGSTRIHSIPRNPIDIQPEMPGR